MATNRLRLGPRRLHGQPPPEPVPVPLRAPLQGTPHLSDGGPRAPEPPSCASQVGRAAPRQRLVGGTILSTRLLLLACILSAALFSAFGGRSSAAATLPSGFGERTFVSGLASPTAMAFAPDGRLFVS